MMVLVGAFAFSSCERDIDFADESKVEIQALVCGPSTFTVTPCDHGFKVLATEGGVPQPMPFKYIIKNLMGVTVDSGFVSHGQVTNPVLAYCRWYTIIITDCNGQDVSFFLKSDGCNNNFLC